MAYTLSSREIARLVGSQAFSRGERYASHGHVDNLSWLPSGAQLYGNVQGTRSTPYVVSVQFTVDAAGTVVRASGVCTCPMKSNCKHVAALLIVSAAAPAASGTHTISTASVGGERRTPTFEPAPAPMPPPPPAWKTALAPLAQHGGSAAPTGTALALQFDVLAPGQGRFTAGKPPQSNRLGAQPMVMGKQNKWIRGNLTWGKLSYAGSSYNARHLKILNSLYALYSASQRYYPYAEQWIHLDGFTNMALWDLLDEARDAHLALISANRTQDPVILSATPATLDLDITRSSDGLVLTPTLTLDDRQLDQRKFGFLGDPAHSIFVWEDSLAVNGHSEGSRLTLAPLANRVSAELRTLASPEGTVIIPTADEPAFLTDYYPFLRQRVTLTSRDGSFDLPETARPVLSLSITHQTDARIELHWEWHYIAPQDVPPTTALYRHALWPAPRDTSYRDETREAEILRSLDGVLAHFPTLSPEHGGNARLGERATLGGSSMIEFLELAVQELTASDDVLVRVSDDAPSYRPADEPPLIRLATTESADSRDWFDLAVTVSIDGEEIPFDELFRALATEQELMILESGTYFSLDRPELHQLRRLIEEARGLQEAHSDSLSISRFQADLWEELQLLGVVAEQAATWRHTVAGLTDATQIAVRPLPDAVHATLRGYQHVGFDWLSFLYDHQLGGILADDMGLGKTLQAIALIAHVRGQQGEPQGDHQGGHGGQCPAPFLVVAPTSVVPNWAAECARFAPGLRVATITQTSAKRATGLAEVIADADVVITSYALFRLDFDEYNAGEWAGLLLDEAQFVKNHHSRAHQSARRLSTPFKLAITGTPFENNLVELWSLLSITAPGLFPNPGRFADYYQKPIEKDADGDRLTQLRRRIRPFMLRRTKDEVASDLPAKQEQVLELELHPKHRKVYDTHLQRERQKVLGLIDDMNANRFAIFRSLTMLRQLSLDASLYDEKYESIPSTKLDALMELLDDTVAEGHRTLIFSQFTKYLAKARSRLDTVGISYSYLDGKTTNRARAIANFKDGDTSVFLISLKAGGFGLNLAEADYCILLDPWWNPATEAQAIDRAHRIGQTRNVMVYRLVSKDTIEEKVMALKATKAKLFESVMADGAARGTGLTAADIRELLA